MAEDIPDKLIEKLRSLCGFEGVIGEPDELAVYECDAYTLARRRPAAVVFPTSTEMAGRVMALLHEAGAPVVARGAGTSLAGGCLPPPGGVVVSTARMRRIIDVDARNRVAHVEAGVTNQAISDAAAPFGLFFAPDPSSQIACTIGGNVATNAGGPHTLKHGVTVNHVLGLTAVLADGRVVTLGGRCEDPIGFDLLGAFVGSEGLFGLVTEVIVRLTPAPQGVRTVLAVYDSLDDATETVSEIIGEGLIPVALEMMDRPILLAVEQAHHVGLETDAEAVLLIEVDGLEAGLEEELSRIAAICRRHRVRRLERAERPEDRERLWQARKHAAGALGRLSPSSCTQDVVVPRTRLPEMLRYVRQVGERCDLRIANVFHAGDGNLHPIMLFDERDADQVRRVLRASRDIVAEAVRLGGTITGEHGVGVEKTEYLSMMYDENDLEAMRRLRSVFDPDLRCNPNKVFPRPSGPPDSEHRM